MSRVQGKGKERWPNWTWNAPGAAAHGGDSRRWMHWCTVCGYFTETRLRRLNDPCQGKGGGTQNLTKFKSLLHPGDPSGANHSTNPKTL